MPYYFYKAVKAMHMKPQNSVMFGTWTGIMLGGLDPSNRNAFGGATVSAAAATGRALSADDATGVGQCLTGSQDYAEGYCTSSSHVLLRITLEDSDLKILVKSAASRTKFDSMTEAVDATECTAIAVIAADKIEYMTEDDEWKPISQFANPPAKDFDE